MSGTDAAGTAQIITDVDVETRKAITALRKLFLNPGEVHLFTRPVIDSASTDGVVAHTERWLSDRYVMINVTDSRVLLTPPPPPEPPAEWPVYHPDGMYKLTAGKGLQPAKEGLVCPDTAGLLNTIEGNTAEWYQMHRTPWSMADDDAKKMLCYADVWHGGLNTPAHERGRYTEPLAINEGIWTQLEEHFRVPVTGEVDPNLKFEYAPGRPYRVSLRTGPVAYVATANFPQTMREQANQLLMAA